ncbi:MAG TPA: hypothetical protein VGM56_18880 [Byssovorax sp.]
MRDEDDGDRALVAERPQGVDHARLRRRVEAARRLVEEEHRLTARDGAREREPLPLASGQRRPAGFERLVEARDEGLRAEGVERGPRTRRAARPGRRAERDVLAERRGDDGRLLRDPRERPIRGADTLRRQVHAAVRDRTRRALEAEQRSEERRLARARRADHGDDLARLRDERRARGRDVAADRRHAAHVEALGGPRPRRAPGRRRRVGVDFERALHDGQRLGSAALARPRVAEIPQRSIAEEEHGRERDEPRATSDHAGRGERHRGEERERGERLVRAGERSSPRVGPRERATCGVFGRGERRSDLSASAEGPPEVDVPHELVDVALQLFGEGGRAPVSVAEPPSNQAEPERERHQRTK